MPTDTVMVKTHDGSEMPAFLAMPESGRGPGIVILQEIFGITDYLKRRARDLAELGYVALVPDLFWRVGSNVNIAEDTQEGLQEAFGYLQKMDEAQAVDDVVAALEYLRARPETGGQAGVLGFCMGGRIAYKVAAASEPDVVVSYYGSGIGSLLSDASRVRSPILFHFGASDAYLPASEAEEIRSAFSGKRDAQVEMHAGAGHAFDNPWPMFHHADASREAWPQTAEFLRRHMPPAARN